MKKLFAGFWIGEFGWELMTWIPYVRAKAKDYDYVIVGCKPGHEPLYEFADEFRHLDYSGNKSEQWMNPPYQAEANKIGISNEFSLRCDRLNPETVYSYSMKTHAQWLTGLQPQEFKKYGGFSHLNLPEIVINIRNRTQHDSAFRNWDINHAREFVSHFEEKRIACIGSLEQSEMLEGCEDWRTHASGQILVNVMLANAKVFISSINGATHLASLCGCPQVAWVTKQEHKERLETTWNPFDIPTKIFATEGDGYWVNRIQYQPPIEELVEAVKAFL